ncbi:MAG: radical SAM protein [Candidatus Omnitrophica bacterium]|nr:radical SAM protein [Candidatus Omnitrophota bacterium]
MKMHALTLPDTMRLKGLLRERPLTGPRMVNIHLLNSCDRRCRFCWYFSPLVSYPSKRQALDFQVLQRLLHDCAHMGVEEINLEGGEIALYPRVAEVFGIVKDLGMRLAAYTHLGYGQDHLDYLWRADRLTVNLSAANAGSYRKIHGGDHFADVIRNLRILRKVSQAKGRPCVVLTFIIYKENFREIPEFIKLARMVAADQIIFRLFKATVEMRTLRLSSAALDELKSILARAVRMQGGLKTNLEEIKCILDNGEWFQDRQELEWAGRHNDRLFYYNNLAGEKKPCYAGWFFAYIDERGRVVAPCDNVGVCVAGNINKQSFRDIWFNSAKLRRVRKEALSGVNVERKRWIECRYCGHVQFNRNMHERLSQAAVRGHDARV